MKKTALCKWNNIYCDLICNDQKLVATIKSFHFTRGEQHIPAALRLRPANACAQVLFAAYVGPYTSL